MNKSNKSLISILVPCYNNQRYLTQALESIFNQSYPNLEIIIGDDKSDEFDEIELNVWINTNRTDNIKRILVVKNEINLGTVANLENMLHKSTGEFIFFLAADDILFNESVLENFYKKAIALGSDAEFFTAQTEMWDISLTKKIGDFISDEDIDKIRTFSTEQLFGESAYRPFIPASNFYRRTIFDKVGSFSGQYRLIEDWSMQLRCLRKGIKIYYLDMVSIKHRDGGISHGNTIHPSRTFLQFYCDLLNAYVNEVRPYESILSLYDRKRAKKFYEDRLRAYYTIHLPNYQKSTGQLTIASDIKAPPQEHLSKKIGIIKIFRYFKQVLKVSSSLKSLVLLLSFCTLFFIASGTVTLLERSFARFVSDIFLFLAFSSAAFLLVEIVVKIIIYCKRNK
ncbi:MAG: glycosyl transferase family 2 [Neobacillus sp.]|jgi:glycosyltransferase involved in cell wall biosynthesis|nr:glycosyl transferase family 2 [Neobacillus sp.]